jgi:hypothetical protein
VTTTYRPPQIDDEASESVDVDRRRPLRSRSAGRPRGLVALSVLTSGCALLYAIYRGYYAFGGTAGMIGVPRSWSEFRYRNLVAVGVLPVAVILPVAAVPLWHWRRPRQLLLALCWVVAVGCAMHALIDDAQRIVSLAGGPAVIVPRSQWMSVDRSTADIQDLAFNEVFFLVEGAALGDARGNRAGSRQRPPSVDR